MARILYLVHRLPYPPNKGDKVRSYHLLRHLAARHEVSLGTFVDDPDDEQHVATVGQWCAEVKAVRLHPRRARLASLGGLLRDEPLTLSYYRDAELDAWVGERRAAGGIDAVVAFSSSMAQYAEDFSVPVLVDFVDVDSAKWTQYASAHRWPMSWLYRREGERLLAYERRVASRARQSFFVTQKEASHFIAQAPESASRVSASCNGVDTLHFAPDALSASPYGADEIPLVFTGAMDYWPNVDAVVWFEREMLPRLRADWPALKFSIVGRNPSPTVQSLAGEAVRVTGTVPDVRPYLQHAAVVVAPLRLARGVQNKVLEAMAMGRPVVASADCVEAIAATPGRDLLAATDADGFVLAIDRLLRDRQLALRVGADGCDFVRTNFSWATQLSRFERILDAAIRNEAIAA